MKKQVFNPFLPLWEYIPDGEPHVFGDRLYLFGSHDKAGGTRYCEQGDYVGRYYLYYGISGGVPTMKQGSTSPT